MAGMMIVRSLLCCTVLLFGSACGSAPSDGGNTVVPCPPRTPPTGAAPGTNQLMPGALRIRIATSSDGLRFDRAGVTVIDQAATPTLLTKAGFPPVVYYTAHKVDGMRDGAAMSIGSEDGKTWQHCSLNVSGLPAGAGVVDPDVVARDDGTIRLYFTAPSAPGGPPAIHYADSRDGANFTYGGVAYTRPAGTIDSATVRIGGGWHMFALPLDTVAMLHASSSDGASFTQIDQQERRIANEPHVLSQGILDGQKVRIFGFNPMGQKIRSLLSSDGVAFSEEPTVHLAFDPTVSAEKSMIKDPAVSRRQSGLYVMAYATAIP